MLRTCDYYVPMAAVRQAQQDLQTYVENTFLPLGAGYADQFEDTYIHT